MNRRTLLAGLTAAAIVSIYVGFAYLPRPRPARPDPSTVVGRLLRSSEYRLALWVPFPHQNLTHLYQKIFDGRATGVEAALRLSGLPVPELPRFGPFDFPPASELTVAWIEAGQRVVVAAHVYPSLAAFSRLAGRVADNPWLAGGEFHADGRRLQVAWQGDVWIVATGGLPKLDETAPVPEPAEPVPALAILEVRQAIDPFPAGRYRLRAEEGSFTVTTIDLETPPDTGDLIDPQGEATSNIYFLLYRGRRQALDEPAQAMAYFIRDETTDPRELPCGAVLFEAGAERWTLPGESVLGLAGREPRSTTAAGWNVAALDHTSLTGAKALAPILGRFSDISTRPLLWAIWLDVEQGLQEASRMTRMMEELPIMPADAVERWSDATSILVPLARRFSRFQVVVTEEPRALTLYLRAREVAE